MPVRTASKVCTSCGERKPLSDFHHYGQRKILIGKWCEPCYQRQIGRRLPQRRIIGAKRRAQKQKARPSWADQTQIDQIRKLAEQISRTTGHPHHVVHWLPLINPDICGLDWELNLRVAPADMNASKSNRFDEQDAERVERASMEWLRSRGLA